MVWRASGLSVIRLMNSGSAQQAQTVANALTGEKTFKRVEFAITGNPFADLMSGIAKVCDESGLAPNARHIQIVLECCAKLYKEGADSQDRISDIAKTSPFVNPVPLSPIPTTGWPPNTIASGPNVTASQIAQWRADLQTKADDAKYSLECDGQTQG